MLPGTELKLGEISFQSYVSSIVSLNFDFKRCLAKEELEVDMVLEVAERVTRMTWFGQRALALTIQGLLNM